ncbi:MAG: ATP synthase subunit I [Trueperaceae bacterium]|jgi:F1F0 ATPase subunit 2|nr:ATP synthase subunit I [Truepera sp.]
MNVGHLLLGYGAGAVLGTLYLLGLWWTVGRAARTGNQSLILISFALRALALLLALYGLLGLGATGLIAALLGFLTARFLLTRLLGRGKEARNDPVS